MFHRIMYLNFIFICICLLVSINHTNYC